MRLLLDLSNNNPMVHARELRASGVVGVWHKVSEGRAFVDETFDLRAPYLRSAGVRVGGYHFARPMNGTATVEAEHFLQHLGRIERRDLRPVLDLEANDHGLTPAQLVLWARAFSQHVHYGTGVWPLLYGSTSFLAALRADRPIAGGLWLADYGPNDGRPHPAHVPPPWRKAVAHQYTSRGRLAGIAGEVDLSTAPRLRPLLARPLLGLF